MVHHLVIKTQVNCPDGGDVIDVGQCYRCDLFGGTDVVDGENEHVICDPNNELEIDKD